VSALAPLRSPPRPVAPGQPPALGTPTAPGAAPPSTATNKPGCNPPYEFDENGNKRWKRECL